MRFLSIAVACATVLVACAPSQPQQTQSAHTATATPEATPAAVASATPKATPVAGSTPARTTAPATATPVASTPQPSASATPATTAAPSTAPAAATSAAVVLPPNAPPQITGLQLNETVVRAGDTISGSVETSTNVASVEARIADYSISVPKVAPGRFALSYQVPNIPFFLKHTYTMVVIARNTAGDQATRSVPVTIR